MTQKIFVLLCGLLISGPAMAQDWGLAIGIHQTSASISGSGATGGSVDGKLGFDVGGLVSFELVPNFRFRSGLLYEQREFDYKANGNKSEFNFAYLDVPVNVQYNFNSTVGVFGGLLVGIQASDSTKVPAGTTDPQIDMKTLYPLINLGLNFTFDDMVGFDVYVERGLGEFASDRYGDSYKNYNVFGLRFVYWL